MSSKMIVDYNLPLEKKEVVMHVLLDAINDSQEEIKDVIIERVRKSIIGNNLIHFEQ